MEKCTLCQGDGLIGTGPKPWLKQGHVTTCPRCAGTGVEPEGAEKINFNESGEVAALAPVQNKDTPANEVAPVDNTPKAKGGILSIFRIKSQ